MTRLWALVYSSFVPSVFLEQLRVVRQRLLAQERYFVPTDIELGPKATAQVVADAEARLGMALPAWLRAFYLEIGGSLSFGFRVNEEAWQADGYPDVGGAEMRIVAVDELAARWVESLVPFTDDGGGNGWCLDRSSPDERVVWHEHDDPDRLRERTLASIEALFHDRGWLEEVLLPGSDIYLSPLLSTGVLPPAPEVVATTFRPWRPEVALERDGDVFSLLAEPIDEAPFTMHQVGDHGVAAGARAVRVVDLATGTSHLARLNQATWTLAAHPEGRGFVAGGEHGLAWIDLQGEVRRRARAGNVTALAIDASGTRLALGTRRGAVELWRYDEGVKLAELPRHDGVVAALVFAGDTLLSQGLDGTLRAQREGDVRWTTQLDSRAVDRDIGARMIVQGDEVLVAAGQLDLWGYRIDDGERVGEPDESLPSAGRLRSLVATEDGFLAGRAGARLEAWSATGAWRWSYTVDDGSEVVGIAPVEGGLVFATTAGWWGRLDPTAIAARSERFLELLAAFEADGLEGGATFDLSAGELMAELQALEAMLGVKLFASDRRSRKRRRAEPPELTDRAVALLCQ